jgi:uncharacterized membrane protein
MSISSGRPKHINLLAGQSVDRLAAISDGIFAVGMTLLVLGLAVPDVSTVQSEGDLLGTLSHLLPSIITYIMSFVTLGIFWVGQQTQINQLARSDRNLTWIHLAFLLAVTLVPFSTGLLAHFILFRTALFVYWVNLLLLGVVLLASLEYSARAGLFRVEGTETNPVVSLFRRRILAAQGMYAVATALSYFDTRLSIALIVLIQMNYAIAPRIPVINRL